MADLNNFFYTDGVDDVTADKINNLLAATLRAEYRNVETLTATRNLTNADTPIQRFTASGASRTVNLPAAGVDNHPFLVVNAGASNNLIVGSLAVLSPGQAALFVSDGTAWYTPNRTIATMRVYTSNGTWTRPSRLAYVVVEVIGGGGAGGGAVATDASSYSAGGGGCGGGYARKRIMSGDLASSVSITVGAGGTGVSGGTGNTGGTSSFGSHLSATGGAGGTALGAFSSSALGGAPGSGGVGVSGDINAYGGPGAIGARNIGATCVGGNGGNSALGGGGTCQVIGGPPTGITGSPGNAYGGGGAGSANLISQSARPGGAGAAGVVIVWEYTEA